MGSKLGWSLWVGTERKMDEYKFFNMKRKLEDQENEHDPPKKKRKVEDEIMDLEEKLKELYKIVGKKACCVGKEKHGCCHHPYGYKYKGFDDYEPCGKAGCDKCMIRCGYCSNYYCEKHIETASCSICKTRLETYCDECIHLYSSNEKYIKSADEVEEDHECKNKECYNIVCEGCVVECDTCHKKEGCEGCFIKDEEYSNYEDGGFDSYDCKECKNKK